MANFIRSTQPSATLPSSKGDQAVYVNDPVNLDLTITYRPSLEVFDFTSKANQVGHREPQLAIVFLCAGNVQVAWFYANAEDRAEDLARLEGWV